MDRTHAGLFLTNSWVKSIRLISTMASKRVHSPFSPVFVGGLPRSVSGPGNLKISIWAVLMITLFRIQIKSFFPGICWSHYSGWDVTAQNPHHCRNYPGFAWLVTFFPTCLLVSGIHQGFYYLASWCYIHNRLTYSSPPTALHLQTQE